MQDNKQNNKKETNWSLWLGLAIPVIMMLFIALSIYVPRIFDDTPEPTINFLFTKNYASSGNYVVKDNQVAWVEHENNRSQAEKPLLYVYDVKTSTSQEINYADAQALVLNTNLVAPDGYRIERSYRRGFFLFDFRSSRDSYLVKQHAAYPINLTGTDLSYYSLKSLGWISE